jgi:hypothetical protein
LSLLASTRLFIVGGSWLLLPVFLQGHHLVSCCVYVQCPGVVRRQGLPASKLSSDVFFVNCSLLLIACTYHTAPWPCFASLNTAFVTNKLLPLLFLQDEIVLVTSQRADGSSARIVFRNNTVVNAAELERLCEKVCGCCRSKQSSSSRQLQQQAAAAAGSRQHMGLS